MVYYKKDQNNAGHQRRETVWETYRELTDKEVEWVNITYRLLFEFLFMVIWRHLYGTQLDDVVDIVASVGLILINDVQQRNDQER